MDDFHRWYDEGVRLGATHMIMVCDTFDYGDFPVYVMPGENVHEVEDAQATKPMQRIMEVYNLSLDKEMQLNESRAFHY